MSHENEKVVSEICKYLKNHMCKTLGVYMGKNRHDRLGDTAVFIKTTRNTRIFLNSELLKVYCCKNRPSDTLML